MTRVIHTGDTHIGYQQYHQPERRQDFLDAFRQVIDDADGVDAIVHAGDLFHDRQPGLQDILGTLSVLRSLADDDIPFLAVVGNHETKRDAQWLDLFESLGLAVRLGREPYVVGDTAFYGMDFIPRSQRDSLTYEFEPHDAAHAMLVAHGLFEPFEYGDWDASEVLQESTVGFDAMLLGDNHTPGQKKVDGTWVTYCGSTERASADETAERGYNIVESENGSEGNVSISRRGLETREFVYVDVDLAAGEGVERVTERVGQHDLTDCVVVVSIEGEGDSIALARIESFIDEQGALVSRVTDRREMEDESEIEVNFADPDEAVRERVRELGLSAAARDIDETVRASKIADANVADEVQRRLQEHLADTDASVFDPDGMDSLDDESIADREAASIETPSTEEGISSDGGEAQDEREMRKQDEREIRKQDERETENNENNGQSTMGEF
jgi:exonuclease SbcD